MINPVEQYTNIQFNTAAPKVFGGFESLVHTYMPKDLDSLWGGEEHFALKSVINLHKVFAVFQVTDRYRRAMTAGIDMSELVSYLESSYKVKTLDNESALKLLDQPNNESIKKVIFHIALGLPDLSYLDAKFIKIGRRKSALYIALLTSKSDPTHASVVVFTSDRKSSRIALFDDLLAMHLNPINEPKLDVYQVLPSPIAGDADI